jgi:predicted MFS family arabinose efflux permease
VDGALNSIDGHRRTDPLRNPALRATLLALAAVLALDAADRTAVGALAPVLEHEFGIGNTAIGLLASAFAVVGGLATLPIGVLTDRVRRMTLIVVAVVVWSLASGVAALAATFAMLFSARIVLGVVTAAGGPPVTSIVGDLVHPDDRGRAIAWVKSGELVGAGAGFVVAGVLLNLSWRVVFAALALLGLGVAWYVSRRPEPSRGGEGGGEGGAGRGEGDPAGEPDGAGEQTLDAPGVLHQLVQEADVEPPEQIVLHGDQSETPLPEALGYVMRVRTVVMVIAASVVAEFFFAALQVFGVLFLVGQFDLSASTAALLIPVVGVGGFIGVVLGGRLGDRLLARGVLTARLQLGAWSYLLVSIAFVPVFLTTSLAVALPFLVICGGLLTAPVAPLEAARLDVVHPQLRGRAESARLLARVAAQAAAPLAFGVLSEALGGGTEGIQQAFLILLPGLALSGVLLLRATRHYPAEVAAVQQSTLESDDDA